MKNSFLFAFVLLSFSANSQTYTVGIQTINYTDAARANRSVGVEFRYPGTNGAVANGQFPFVIFAHGFQMDQVPYYPYADSLAKQGYIVGLLTTETSLSPSHANFAQDLIFVYNKLISESNTNSGSPFYQKVIPKGALGGHSMGGGSTVLSCQYSNPAACYFTFAAAVTNPSSTTAAPSMTKPYLSFAGSRDCIAPIASHQQLMYDASGSSCKFLINITNGLHCQFGSGNFQCNFGEGFSGCASSTLSRADQINKTLHFLAPFLNYYLKGDCSAWTLFENRYSSNTTDVKQRNCTNIIPANPSISGNNYFCNGSSTTLTAQPDSLSYVWNDNSTADTLNVSAQGNYSVIIGNGVCSLPAVSVTMAENFPPATPSAITASDTVCSNITNISISVANDANSTMYYWSLPSGWSITSGNNTNAIEVTSNTNGGTISVTAENDCGISSAVQKNMVVVPSNLGTVGIITGDTLFCEGDTAQFYITRVSGADSYIWIYPFGWSVIGGNGNDTLLFSVTASSGTINVQAENDCGQSLPSVLNVRVKSSPTLTGEIIGLDTVCESVKSSYYYLSSVANADTVIWWTTPPMAVASAGGIDTVLVYNAGWGGTIWAYASNSCGNTATISSVLFLADTPQVIVLIQGNQIVSQTTGRSYQWYLNGIILPVETDSVITPSQSGNYSLTVTNDNGCIGMSQTVNFIYTQMEEIDVDVFSIYPNPNSNGWLQLQAGKAWTGAEIKIFDIEGRVALKSEIKSQSSEISTVKLVKGLYLLCIDKNGNFLRKKLVIE